MRTLTCSLPTSGVARPVTSAACELTRRYSHGKENCLPSEKVMFSRRDLRCRLISVGTGPLTSPLMPFSCRCRPRGPMFGGSGMLPRGAWAFNSTPTAGLPSAVPCRRALRGSSASPLASAGPGGRPRTKPDIRWAPGGPNTRRRGSTSVR